MIVLMAKLEFIGNKKSPWYTYIHDNRHFSVSAKSQRYVIVNPYGITTASGKTDKISLTREIENITVEGLYYFKFRNSYHCLHRYTGIVYIVTEDSSEFIFNVVKSIKQIITK